MQDYMELGPTPAAEPCAQVGSDNYDVDAREECGRYKNLLIERFGHPERFGIKRFPHDFGSYYEVVVYFDDDDQESLDFAINVEHNIPENW